MMQFQHHNQPKLSENFIRPGCTLMNIMHEIFSRYLVKFACFGFVNISYLVDLIPDQTVIIRTNSFLLLSQQTWIYQNLRSFSTKVLSKSRLHLSPHIHGGYKIILKSFVPLLH